MIAFLVPLWLLWLLVWVVLSIVIASQGRKLLQQLAENDEQFEFLGWFRFIGQCWRFNFSYPYGTELYSACIEYRQLLRLWLGMALLVIFTRLTILILDV